MYTLITGKGCSKCETAKKILTVRKQPFKEIDFESKEARLLIDSDKRAFAARSLPIIFDETGFVGSLESLTF